MTLIRGTIRREDLSGGYLVLVADDGKRYLLGGATKAVREEGLRVELEGELQPGGGPSIAVTSEPIFRVTKSKRL